MCQAITQAAGTSHVLEALNELSKWVYVKGSVSTYGREKKTSILNVKNIALLCLTVEAEESSLQM